MDHTNDYRIEKGENVIMPPSMKKFLPLIHILEGLSDSERQIVLDHLDQPSLNAVTRAVKTVLADPTTVSPSHRNDLAKAVQQNKNHFTSLLNKKVGGGKKKSSCCAQKRALTRIGGNPLAIILSTAVPLLIDLLRKK